jgi:hypothetical protein
VLLLARLRLDGLDDGGRRTTLGFLDGDELTCPGIAPDLVGFGGLLGHECKTSEGEQAFVTNRRDVGDARGRRARACQVRSPRAGRPARTATACEEFGVAHPSGLEHRSVQITRVPGEDLERAEPPAEKICRAGTLRRVRLQHLVEQGGDKPTMT